VLSIDPSGRGQDETGIAVVNHLHGKIFVPYIDGISGGYDESLLKIAEIAKEYKVNKVVVESNFGDGMYSKLLTPVLNAVYPCTIEEIRNNIQKERRIIDTLEPLMNQHRLVFDYSTIKKDVSNSLNTGLKTYYSAVFQMTHINYERGSLIHDDRLDALCLGIQYWNEYGILKQDSKFAIEQYNKKIIDDELRRRANIFKNMGNKQQKRSVAVGYLRAFN
jgi:hypothetical protein